jgi:hypothetical protein
LKKKHPYSWIVGEVVIVFLYLLLLNNFLGRKEVVIVADGKGYYDYLPATFIYKDLNFGYTDTLVTEYYKHQAYNQGINPLVDGKKVNKYFIGTALAQLPFFLSAHFIAKTDQSLLSDGYSSIYQDFVFYSALFYAFLGLFFLRKSLQLVGLQIGWIYVLQLITIFASSLMHYMHAEASFSHVYSFAFISWFAFLVISHRLKQNPWKLYLIAVVLGIIVLIRPANLLVLLFAPFLHDSFGEFLWTTKQLLHKWKQTLIALGIFFGLIFLQPLIWYIQTGSIFIKPYGHETFHFSQSHVFDFLFSYQKGFFVYAPVFFVGILIGCYAAIKRNLPWQIISFFSAFLLLIYVLSCWWNWIYGASYGSRVMIDYYTFIVLFMSSIFMLRSFWLKAITSIILITFTYVSIIQTYQYQHYILHWTDMDKASFWKVFLRTEEKYKGLLWLQKYDFSNGIKMHKISVSPEKIKQAQNWENSELVHEKFDLFGQGNYVVSVQLKLESPNGEDKVLVIWDDTTGNNHYYHEMHVFKGTQQYNYRGDIQLHYSWRTSISSTYLLKVFYNKHEASSWLKQAEVILYEMP